MIPEKTVNHFGDIAKYNLGSAVDILVRFTQGAGDLRHLPSIYVVNNLTLEVCTYRGGLSLVLKW